MAAVAAEALGVPARVGAGRHGHGGRGRRPVHHPPRRRAPDPPCWPRTRPGGPSCSTWCAPGTAPVVVGINARVADGRGPVVAVGRALRAAGRAAGGGHRRALSATCRSACATPRWPTRRCADPVAARGRRPARAAPGRRRGAGRGRVHRQLHRLPRPVGAGGERAGSGGRRLPRPARHLRRRRQRAGAGPAGGLAGLAVELVQAPSGRPLPTGRPLLPGRRRGRPPGAGGRRRSSPTARLAGAVARGRGGAGGVRRLPDRRARRSPRPTDGPPRASACSTSTTVKGPGRRAVGEVVAERGRRPRRGAGSPP